jgi:hypothetical protein
MCDRMSHLAAARRCTRPVERADANEDGQISKDEATTLTKVIGGFFFRSGTNNSQLTEEKAARAMGQLVRRLGIQPPTAKR